MERIEVLISKLKEQFDQHADPAQMLVTIHLLEAELSKLQVKDRRTLGTSKVSVMLPRSINVTLPSGDGEKRVDKKEESIRLNPEMKESENEKNGSDTPARKKEHSDFAFDPMIEIPTLSHQQSVKEINEAIAVKQESLNDKLRQSKIELVEILKEAPIRDLRKAIGINDRFVFISELFRGDEAMYERSIKTINSFNIYAEAEYWINRELKTKIGWDEQKQVVQHFYQLVKRRFF